jgi:hypothetical protein
MYSTNGTKVSPVKITGVSGDQVIVRMEANKRHLFYCNDSLKAEFEEIYPKRVKITHTDDTILSYELVDGNR